MTSLAARPRALASLFLALCLLALPAAPLSPALGQAPAGEADTPPLPLKRVVLFSSSVGFFEHGGSVEGNQQIEFTFKTADINDLLKSVVVQDRDGGLISTVNYGSPDPLTRTLRTFTIDLTESPTLAEIFQQLRGHAVQLETPTPVTGTVVGVEQRTVPAGGEKYVQVEVLNLRTKEGLRSIRLDAISRTQFVSPKVDQEFQKALDLIAGAHDSELKRVKFDFRGAGKRRVDVGYIQEAPVWKTSYRLVLDDKEQPFLQGWAIVENTTTQDWREVQLSLVSGRPISFVMELSQPLFMARPLITPELHAALAPKVYEQDLASREREFRAAGGGMGGFGGGGMFGGGGALGGSAEPQGGRPLVTSVIPVVDGDLPSGGEIDPTQGVQAAAAGGEVGELFRYGIKTPVTIPRNESAMLPIVNSPVKGEKVAIYNPSVHAKHPLSGLRLTNTTDLHLLQGPVTVFDGGEYAGDARIEDLAPGSDRLLSYALDLETEVAVEAKPAEEVITRLSIRQGGLHIQKKLTRGTSYTVKNSGKKAQKLLIERPLEEGWKPVQPTTAEKTRSAYRFSSTAEPGKPAVITVVEERATVDEVLLADLEPESLTLYAKLPAASPKLLQAFEKIIQSKTQLAQVARFTAAKVQEAAALEAEQDRLRANMQALPAIRTNELVSEENKKATNELLNRYLKRLGSIDAELDRTRAERTASEEEFAKVERALAQLLADLVVE